MNNYSNQNMYNTAEGASFSVSQDKSVKVIVKDYSSKKLICDEVRSNNGKIKRTYITQGKQTHLEARYNKAFGYWCTENGDILTYEEDKLNGDGKLGLWVEQTLKVKDVDKLNGYKRRIKRSYYYLDSLNPDYAGKKCFVHHIMAYCWVTGLGGHYIAGQTVVDHIDEDSTNNSASNLQYLTKEQNINKANLLRGAK